MHPLEGKYVVYLYGHQDYEDERWSLALYRLQNGRLEEVFHPDDYGNPLCGSYAGSITDEALIDLMKKRGIAEVYTVFHHGQDFYGIPGDFISLHESDTEPEEIELWAEWRPVEEDYYRELLRRNGISLRVYDPGMVLP